MNLWSHWNIMGGKFQILFPIPKVKDADLRQLSFTIDLVQVLNVKTVSYCEQCDAFCYHNTQFCMTCLHGITLDVRTIVAPTVCSWLASLWMSLGSGVYDVCRQLVPLWDGLMKNVFWWHFVDVPVSGCGLSCLHSLHVRSAVQGLCRSDDSISYIPGSSLTSSSSATEVIHFRAL